MTSMRLRRAPAVVLSAALLATAACTKNKTETPTTTTTLAAPTTVPTESTTTTAPVTKESIVLAPNGLGAGLPFGLNSARAINVLIQALGNPDKNTNLPVGQACGATRRLQWGDFQALVNEVGASSGAGKPGFAGWFLGAPGSATHLGFKTEKGITVGSTVAALKAAYPNAIVARGEQGPGYNVTLDKGIILGQLDALTDAGKVKNIQAGSYCGAG
jgi:hypothetical protein